MIDPMKQLEACTCRFSSILPCDACVDACLRLREMGVHNKAPQGVIPPEKLKEVRKVLDYLPR
jgi:hypothetical protein